MFFFPFGFDCGVAGFSYGNRFHPSCCTGWYMNYFAGDIPILLVAALPR
jgi:hypothetical protein